MQKKTTHIDSNSFALKGFLFTLPFIIMNFIVSLRIEPFYYFLGSFPAIRNSTFIPLVLLLLFPIGAFVSITPVLAKQQTRTLSRYIPNITVTVVMLIIFCILFGALGEEFYRCDILKIPNCD